MKKLAYTLVAAAAFTSSFCHPENTKAETKKPIEGIEKNAMAGVSAKAAQALKTSQKSLTAKASANDIVMVAATESQELENVYCDETDVWTTCFLNIRSQADVSSDRIVTVVPKYKLTKIGTYGDWTIIRYNGVERYVITSALTDVDPNPPVPVHAEQPTQVQVTTKSTEQQTQLQQVESPQPAQISTQQSAVQQTEQATDINPPAAQHLTKQSGVFYGPSGKETYYNLDMSNIVHRMAAYGYGLDDYCVREDGVKTLHGYVMVAADLNQHPRGSTVETSLGTGIVCDTGAFATNGSGTALDIAVAW